MGADDGVAAERGAGFGIEGIIGGQMHAVGAKCPDRSHVSIDEKGDVTVMGKAPQRIGEGAVDGAAIAGTLHHAGNIVGVEGLGKDVGEAVTENRRRQQIQAAGSSGLAHAPSLRALIHERGTAIILWPQPRQAAISSSRRQLPRAARLFILARCAKAAWALATFSALPAHAFNGAAWSARP